MSALVVDSSVYIHWLKQRTDFVSMLYPWISEGLLYQCGIIRTEVLRGIKDPKQRQQMSTVFEVACEVQLIPAFWDGVVALAWSLDRQGVIVPLPDLAIAQCALDRDATLVSLDEHFRYVPGLKWNRTLPAR